MNNDTTGSQTSATAGATRAATTVKLCVRLLDAVNLPLRDLVRFQGELAGFISEAIETVDLDKVPLVVIRDAKAKDTTIRVNESVFDRLATRAFAARLAVVGRLAVEHLGEDARRRGLAGATRSTE